MKSAASTITEYLAELPDDRRAAIEQVREVILGNIPKGYEEVMNWGMITYQVPLSAYPDTYNKQPLMYAALASQKNYMAVYLMCAYGQPSIKQELVNGFAAAGKKLDMGGGCVRFKKVEDLPLDVIAKVIASTEMDAHIAFAKAARKK